MGDDKNGRDEAYRRKLDQHGFTLEEQLGYGSFGTVYRATQKQFKRSVAVKFFNVDLARGPANRKRFTREAHLLARVDHPSVPYVLTAGYVDLDFDVRVPYFVMQFISGKRLDEEIKREGQLKFPRSGIPSLAP